MTQNPSNFVPSPWRVPDLRPDPFITLANLLCLRFLHMKPRLKRSSAHRLWRCSLPPSKDIPWGQSGLGDTPLDAYINMCKSLAI